MQNDSINKAFGENQTADVQKPKRRATSFWIRRKEIWKECVRSPMLKIKKVANQKLIYLLSCLCFKYVIKLGVVTWTWNRKRINFLLSVKPTINFTVFIVWWFRTLEVLHVSQHFLPNIFYETKQEMKLTENHTIIILLHQPTLRLLLCGQFPKCGWSFGATN